ncbi:MULTISPECIES: DNA-binding transcriptional regulator OxyR [unclassified Agarivorans]|uniref:DNA-binding transcriptional regulator OxyR n=1 Tax=unclassified Agarivorans TaxID=2636026 RepID=UPI0010E6696E|nr:MULTISPECIES: DNA-binding transcriptional regulator OxyR [unclassified Agarivorans]MDO6686794.1 DNA-binding transcriptional regulator OxyR [Agarivorans sp. 3_MG-2023]MDO6716476.1 DNA-binding transcriptional regulator OxyR [Agarivorans sp. 2_MG-2023]MDO6765447.1 DNA-binding transcriptional regulator OxyR [Agarivorans sp. 1_MG-2023]GDY26741.1 DNA-binding transcriptional regulator OxyR [Agarivorans sp. Toyoura001]
MNLRDLEYLVALQELKHFRKAAEKCFVSQPTLSGQIAKLEEELGLLLIERTSRKVIFTHAGDELAAKARTILLEVKGLKDMAKSFQAPMAGPLHVGLIPTVAPYLLPKIVPHIREEFSEMELFLYEEQTHVLLQRLEEGELDCLLLAYLPDMERFGSIDLFDEPLMLAMPSNHKWQNQQEVQLSELSGEQVLMLEDGHCLRDQAMGYCFAAGAKEDTSFKATSLETLRHMVAAGMGITLLPQLAIPDTEEQNGICYRHFSSPEPSRRISLLYRNNSVRRPCFNQLAKLIQSHTELA